MAVRKEPQDLTTQVSQTTQSQCSQSVASEANFHISLKQFPTFPELVQNPTLVTSSFAQNVPFGRCYQLDKINNRDVNPVQLASDIYTAPLAFCAQIS